MGLCNLEHVEEAAARRRALSEAYEKGLREVPGIRLFEAKPETKRNYGYFPILVEEEYPLSRDELYERLKEKGIHTRKYFYPLTSDQACFMNRYRDVELGCARELAERVLVLPMYEGLEREDLSNVVELIKKS